MDYTLEQTIFGYFSVKNLPTDDEIKEYYKEKYYQNNLAQYSHSYSEGEYIFFENKAKVAEYIFKKYYNTHNVSLLDVGAGEGFFAKYFLKNNWKVTTLDYSNCGITNHSPLLLETLIQGDVFKSLENLMQQNTSFNLINLSNILEHVTDPILLLKNLKSLLSRESLIRISVPNDYSDFQNFLLENKQTTNTWFCPPEHLHYFTFNSLSNLLEYLNYEIVLKIAEFPVELFLSNELSNYANNRENGKFAHASRVEVDNFLFNEGMEKYLNYYKSSAEIGIGRQVVIFAKVKE